MQNRLMNQEDTPGLGELLRYLGELVEQGAEIYFRFIDNPARFAGDIGNVAIETTRDLVSDSTHKNIQRG